MSKRSSRLSLVLMASTTAAALLTGCSEPQTEGQAYSNKNSCIASGNFTEAQCNDSWEDAEKQHVASAPRYDQRQLCEEQHGLNACENRSPSQQSSGGSFWSPLMTGFFVAQALNNTGANHYYSRALYRSNSGGILTSDGYRLNRNSTNGYSLPDKGVKTKPKAAKVQTRTSVVARGGFGKSFGSRSFGG